MSIRARVNPRRLDQRVRFERLEQHQSSSGAPRDAWVPITTCWAAVDGAKAKRPEPREGEQTLSMFDYTVWIRSDVFARFTIKPLDRIVWKDRVLDIKDVPDQGLRGRLIAVTCHDGANDG